MKAAYLLFLKSLSELPIAICLKRSCDRYISSLWPSGLEAIR